MSDRPLVGICLLIYKGDSILLGKRLTKHAHGCYGAPGGHLEYGESFEECAMRELREEAGNELMVSPPKFGAAINAIYPESHYVTVFMQCDWISGEPQTMEPNKCEGWEFHSLDNLPSPLMLALDQLLNGGEHTLE
jgi:8-oxo-dGTP diphosphatase